MWGEVALLSDRTKKGGREEEKEYRKRMVVPLWSHMTNLCLLQGVRAAGQSQPSLPLSILHSLSLSLSLKHMHLLV